MKYANKAPDLQLAGSSVAGPFHYCDCVCLDYVANIASAKNSSGHHKPIALSKVPIDGLAVQVGDGRKPFPVCDSSDTTLSLGEIPNQLVISNWFPMLLLGMSLQQQSFHFSLAQNLNQPFSKKERN